MRFARGPFWLGSISKLTRSPPASESKLTLESRPVRWKKYSFPSSAAMNPNPRSETSFLMVPVGIPQKLLFSKASRERTGPFEKIRPRRTSPDYRGQVYLTSLRSEQSNADQRGGGTRELGPGARPLPKPPDPPHRDCDDRRLPNW